MQRLILVALAPGLSACDGTQAQHATSDPTPGALSRRSEDAMTMQQVYVAIVYQPNEVFQSTCSTATGQTWTCRRWRFGVWNNYLDITFENDAGV